MDYDDLVRILGKGKAAGDGLLYPCPAHADSTNSLKISRGKNNDIVLHCFASCTFNQIVDAFSARGEWTRPRKNPKKTATAVAEKTCVATYEYDYENGTHCARKLRFEPKEFKQEGWGPDGWDRAGLKGVVPPLYLAPQLKFARETEATVYLCEGEKDVGNLLAAGAQYATTTFVANKWLDEWTEQLRGCSVVILPDNDQTGKNHVNTVAPKLQEAGISVKVIWLPGLTKKGDVTDWLKAGGTLKKLERLVAQAKEWQADIAPPIEGTEMSAVRHFVKQCGADLKHSEERGWMVWDGKRGKPSAKAAAQKAQNALMSLPHYDLATKMQSATGVRHLLQLAEHQPEVEVNQSEFDCQPDLINCLNGVLDLRDGVLREHSRDLLCSKLMHLEFGAHRCPQWMTFLDHVMDGDVEMIEYLQRAVGYSLSGHTKEQVLFFCYGFGKNGKSLFLETIKRMLGEYATSINKNSIMVQDRNNGIRNDIARLVNARFVAASELTQGERLDEGMVKDMTGGTDTLTARFLRKEYFDFYPQFKLWMRGNHKPDIGGQDFGIWRRIHLIPFEVQISDAEDDKELSVKLLRELPGIFCWAVEGHESWRVNGLMPPAKVQKAVDQYRFEMDTVGRFLKDRCATKTPFDTRASLVYKAYREWCDENGHRAMSLTKFGLSLKQRGVQSKPDNGKRVRYIGLQLLDDNNEGESDYE